MTAILLDIDGVLHVSGDPIPGAADAVRALRADGHRLRFVTNNTTRARARLARELQEIGIELDEDEVSTTPIAAGKLLAGIRVLALTMASVREDLAAHVTLVEEDAEAVLLGGADETAETGEVFAYENLNRAFAALREGARLVCLHKNRWWRVGLTEARLDAGVYVAGLEYAAGVQAEVVGKPTAAYFESALDELVRPGKFEEETLNAADPQPDAVIDSIAELPALLSRRAASPSR